MQQELNDSILTGIGILLGAGVPLVAIVLVRDFFSNFAAGIQIKLNTNFQYINSFEFDSRKQCRVSNITWTTIQIQDMASDQFITVFNREFLKARVWRNIDRAKKDS